MYDVPILPLAPTDLLHPPAPHFRTFKIFLTCSSKRPNLAPYEAMLQMQHFTSFFIKFKSNLHVKEPFLLNAALVTCTIRNFRGGTEEKYVFQRYVMLCSF